MGWVEMSERELRRAEVLALVYAGRLTMTAAAGLMGVTRRQAHRLARLFADQGCQSALKNDPGSALNFDPARDDGSGAMVMRFDGSGPVLEAPALVAGLDDVTVMG
jgi:hypothetical protein